MRVSEHFSLGRSQPSLEFIDVDIYGDTRLFIDPRAIRELVSPWTDECISLLQSFFSEVLAAIRAGQDDRARSLLSALREPNETHLGVSVGRAQGRGMGDELARQVWDSLKESRATATGLLQDLEDTALFVPGIGPDVISDITTNIIRGPMIQFTQDACAYYGIPLNAGIASGRQWDHHTKLWRTEYASLPMTPHGPLILVPKSIVRRQPMFDPGHYYYHYVLPALQEKELVANSALVEVLKTGRRRVTKRAIEAKYGRGKGVNLDATLVDPSILQRYRDYEPKNDQPMDHAAIAAHTATPEPDWDALLADVLAVVPGKEEADAYHRAIDSLLTPLLYPALDFPKREHKIHEDRKRIDINYTNVARGGFFHWLHDVQEVPCSQIPVECKNYGKAVKNPEFDQLAGRFSVNRGKFGLLCYRGYADKADVVKRCRDAVHDGRGFIVALDDDDLSRLVEARKSDPGASSDYLMARFQELL